MRNYYIDGMLLLVGIYCDASIQCNERIDIYIFVR